MQFANGQGARFLFECRFLVSGSGKREKPIESGEKTLPIQVFYGSCGNGNSPKLVETSPSEKSDYEPNF